MPVIVTVSVEYITVHADGEEVGAGGGGVTVSVRFSVP